MIDSVITLAMPMRCVVALRLHRIRQRAAKRAAGQKWREHGHVFASQVGTELDAPGIRPFPG
ncbi:hypothetical protein [Amycolatopsis taiwanensis]|uniref:Uncharacterized protein n=1 Tax=Amycolatopsis taiwanensis TaxID=342230 RepID=A0A9W6VGN9_9PSEU|nr:hypothetical protein [Amycolatopsis taiwanensis]GLY67955.1 hypothetical protein Atai01_45740 [Amycolatopsis taiwanensis]